MTAGQGTQITPSIEHDDAKDFIDVQATPNRNLIEKMKTFLAGTRIFSGVPDADLTLLAQSSQAETINQGEVLFDPEHPETSKLLIAVETLRVKVNDTTDAIIPQDAPLGEFNFLEGMTEGVQMPPSAKITAMNTVPVIRFHEKLSTLGLSEQGIAQILINILGNAPYLEATDGILDDLNASDTAATIAGDRIPNFLYENQLNIQTATTGTELQYEDGKFLFIKSGTVEIQSHEGTVLGKLTGPCFAQEQWALASHFHMQKELDRRAAQESSVGVGHSTKGTIDTSGLKPNILIVATSRVEYAYTEIQRISEDEPDNMSDQIDVLQALVESYYRKTRGANNALRDANEKHKAAETLAKPQSTIRTAVARWLRGVADSLAS